MTRFVCAFKQVLRALFKGSVQSNVSLQCLDNSYESLKNSKLSTIEHVGPRFPVRKSIVEAPELLAFRVDLQAGIPEEKEASDIDVFFDVKP